MSKYYLLPTNTKGRIQSDKVLEFEGSKLEANKQAVAYELQLNNGVRFRENGEYLVTAEPYFTAREYKDFPQWEGNK